MCPQAGDITIPTPVLESFRTRSVHKKSAKDDNVFFLLHDKLLIGLEGLFVPAWDAAIPLIKCEETYLRFI